MPRHPDQSRIRPEGPGGPDWSSRRPRGILTLQRHLFVVLRPTALGKLLAPRTDSRPGSPPETKVLHRKRPRLIPMLDSVVLGHYLSGPERRSLFLGMVEKYSPDSAADAAMVALASFKT